MSVLPCRILPVLLTALFFGGAAGADTLTLKSGKVVEGKIVGRDRNTVQLDVGLDFPITYYLDEIKDISQSTEKPSSAAPAQPLAAAVDNSDPNPNGHKADELEQQGLALIEKGQTDDGVKLLREAIRVDPQANRHLNLGSILFGNAVALQKKGNADDAVKTFQESETELLQAIKQFDPNGETTFISEAYDLLGEMYANGLHDKAKAKMYYEKSLSFYDNPAAKRGLEGL